MTNKKAPYVFLTLLIVILAFILGTRYGQKVEQTNKVINYLISLPPTKPPPPSPLPLEFKKFNHKGCRISFLYPSNLKISDQSTSSAILTENGQEKIEFSCDPLTKIKNVVDDENTATAEVMLKNKKTIVKSIDLGSTYVFALTNQLTGKKIYLLIVKNLFPLFEKSLEFTTP